MLANVFTTVGRLENILQRTDCRTKTKSAIGHALMHKENPVIQMIRRMKMTANESHIGLALGVSAVMMGLLLWAIIWQSDVIAYQRDLIKWMWSAKFGG
mgnify:CR=1 FL=1